MHLGRVYILISDLTRLGGAPSRGSNHSRVPASSQRGRPFSMTIGTCPNPTTRAIRSTSLTTLAIISLFVIGILAHMFSHVNARKLSMIPPRLACPRDRHPRPARPRGHSVTLYPHLLHFTHTSALPASPSTVIVCPLRMRRVATPVPITAGMPNSRATMKLRLSDTTCRPRRCRSCMRAGLRRHRNRRSSWPACPYRASAAASWQALQGRGKHSRAGKSDCYLPVSQTMLKCGLYA